MSPGRRFWHRLRSRESVLLGIAMLASLSVGALRQLPWSREALQLMEWKIEDYFHITGRLTPPDNSIVILGVDDASLKLESAFPEDIEASPALKLMQRGWIWPRAVYAHAIDRLLDAGAKTVVLDFAFSTPTLDHPEWDAALHDALDRHRDRVIVGADVVSRLHQGGKSEDLVPPCNDVLEDTTPKDQRLGFLTYWADVDEVVRTIAPSVSLTGDAVDRVPSLAAAILRQQGDLAEIPSGDGPLAIRFGNPNAYQPLTLHEIFVEPMWESNFAGGEFFKGKTVFIGPAARHMHDELKTPVGTLFGVQMHAQVLAAMRVGALLKHAAFGWRLVALMMAALAAWGLVAWLRRPLVALVILAGGVVAGLMLQQAAFNRLDLVFPMLVPVLGWSAAGLFGLGYDFVLERQRRKDLMRYFSPDLAEELARNPAPYLRLLGGVHRTITLLFSDLRGFTSLSESHEADALVMQLNQYLDRMVEIVFSTNGSIDKFIGDAVMAVWGRVRDKEDAKLIAGDAVAAVEAALRMREALADLNKNWRKQGWPALKFGVGIHQGEVIVGNIGSTSRMEFTAIGDNVNLGSRLEGITKEYGVDLIISEAVHVHVSERFICRTADLVRVKGKEKPVEVFTVLGRKGEMEPPAGLAAYEEGVVQYRAGRFEMALQCCQNASALGLDDALTGVVADRCREYLEHPPEGVWDGVYRMTRK